MKKIIIAIQIILAFCSFAFATPAPTSVSGNTVYGSGFGTHTNNTAGGSYLCVAWDNFDNGIKDGVYTLAIPTSISLTTSGNMVGSTYCIDRSIATTGGAMYINEPNTNSGFYTYYWMKFLSGTTTDESGNHKTVEFRGTGGTGGHFPMLTFEIKSSGTVPNATFYYSIYGDDGYIQNHYITGNTFSDNNWHCVEFWFKPCSGASTNDGIVTLTIDGDILYSATNLDTWDNSGGGGSYNGDWNVCPYLRGYSKDILMDNIFFDYTQARVMIGNNPVFENCTHREIQIPTAWSDTSITITYNNGSFVPGDRGYLFVIDSDGNASAGYDLGTLQSDGTWGNLKPVQATNLTMSNVTVGE